MEASQKKEEGFTPKVVNIGHTIAKDYIPISLSYFLLKIMERLLDFEIWITIIQSLISKS